MDRANEMYGHRYLLAAYSGLRKEPPIWGHLQHAWNPDKPFSSPDMHSRLWPQFVFNSRNLAAGKAAGFGDKTPLIAVGDPFLYLDAMARKLGYGDSEKTGTGTIVYPRHSNGYDAHVARSDFLADDILRREGSNVTICLHFYEYINLKIRSVYADRGFRVICHGAVHDRHFLIAQYLELLKHDRVVSNAAGTALWHGGLLGLRMQIYGPEFREPLDHDWNFALADHQRRWPILFEEGLQGSEARQLAQNELGHEHMKSPAELIHLFGWSRLARMRSAGLALALAPRRRWQDVWTTHAAGGWPDIGVRSQREVAT